MLQIYDFILIQPYKNEIKINISTTLMRFVGAKSRTASYALLLIGKTLPGERHGRRHADRRTEFVSRFSGVKDLFGVALQIAGNRIGLGQVYKRSIDHGSRFFGCGLRGAKTITPPRPPDKKSPRFFSKRGTHFGENRKRN